MKKFTSVLLALILAFSVLAVLPLSASAAITDSATVISSLDTAYAAVLRSRGDEAFFSFTPAENGRYKFYTDDETYSLIGGLVDENGDYAQYDGAAYAMGGLTVGAVFTLEAGQTYYFSVELTQWLSPVEKPFPRSYSVYMTKFKDIKAVDVIENKNSTYVAFIDTASMREDGSSYLYYPVRWDCLTLRVTYTDDTVKITAVIITLNPNFYGIQAIL